MPRGLERISQQTLYGLLMYEIIRIYIKVRPLGTGDRIESTLAKFNYTRNSFEMCRKTDGQWPFQHTKSYSTPVTQIGIEKRNAESIDSLVFRRRLFHVDTTTK
jgi:hypothetical protein